MLRPRWLLRSVLTLALGVPACSKSVPSSEPPSREGAREDAANGNAPAAIAEMSMVVSDDEILDLLEDEEGIVRRFMPVIDGPEGTRGSASAPLHLVVYFGYQCPFCGRLNGTLNEILLGRERQLLITYRHFPLPMHKGAKALARASIAAAQLGVFNSLHDELFTLALSTDIERDLRPLVEKTGVDFDTFRTLMDSPEVRARLFKELEQTRQDLGVRSTPTLFLNGRTLKGALPEDRFAEEIDDEQARINRLVVAGIAPGRVAERIQGVAAHKPLDKSPAAKPRPGRPDPDEAYAVPADGRPSSGPRNALVTMIQFQDFECEMCAKNQATLDDLRKRYPLELRIVFRHHPLPMHAHAKGAARAAWAAGEQGKFWEMHKLLFENTRVLDDAKFVKLAKKLHLDVRRFNRDRKSAAAKKAIEEDQAVAAQYGVRGAPGFFINGRFLSGAQPIEKFVALIDLELAKARKVLAERSGSRSGFYEALIYSSTGTGDAARAQ